jgi:hypothetical protein
VDRGKQRFLLVEPIKGFLVKRRRYQLFEDASPSRACLLTNAGNTPAFLSYGYIQALLTSCHREALQHLNACSLPKILTILISGF